MTSAALPSPRGERGLDQLLRSPRATLLALLALVAALSVASLAVGAQPLRFSALLAGDEVAWTTFTESRLPRTVAIVLSGAAVGIAGLVMQLLARNRFVEPGTIGANDAAALALVLVSAFAPGLPVAAKIGVGVVGALAGTALFFVVIQRFRHREGLIIPLIGLVLGSVIGALTSYLAFHFDLVQSLGSWMSGNFSGVIGGRYELLWLVLVALGVIWWAADRLTAAGVGETFARSVGVNHTQTMVIGLVVAAVVSAIVVVVVGGLPFLGLVVPNIARSLVGDHVRRGLPVLAATGALLVLVCDLIARVVRFPYELPVGLVIGMIGGAIFLGILLRQKGRPA